MCTFKYLVLILKKNIVTLSHFEYQNFCIKNLIKRLNPKCRGALQQAETSGLVGRAADWRNTGQLSVKLHLQAVNIAAHLAHVDKVKV